MLDDLDRSAKHGGEQHGGDSGAQGDERSHAPTPASGGFDGEDGERDEHRQHDERDQQVDPQRDSSDGMRHVASNAPPHECLDQLVRTEKQRERREQEVAGATAQVAERVDTDRADDDAADDVSLWREAHTAPEHPWRPSLTCESPEVARIGH